MISSNQNIMCSDFESGLEKNKTFKTTASLPLQWFLLTLLLQRAGSWSVHHGDRVWSCAKIFKTAYLLVFHARFFLCY